MQTSKLDRAGVFRFALNPADGGGSVTLSVASGDKVELGYEAAGAYTKIGTYTADTSQTFPDSADFIVVRKMPGGTGISSVTVNDGAGSTGAPGGSTTPAAVATAINDLDASQTSTAWEKFKALREDPRVTRRTAAYYGASHNQSADLTRAALQTAIDDLYTNFGGGVISIPSSTMLYAYGLRLRSNVAFIADTFGPGLEFGSGGAAAVLRMPSGAPKSQVCAAVLNAGGSGYSTAPAVSFSGPGTGATATAYISSGAVVFVEITDPGEGYTSAPTITFTGGGGTGADATAIVAASLMYSTGAAVNNTAMSGITLWGPDHGGEANNSLGLYLHNSQGAVLSWCYAYGWAFEAVHHHKGGTLCMLGGKYFGANRTTKNGWRVGAIYSGGNDSYFGKMEIGAAPSGDQTNLRNAAFVQAGTAGFFESCVFEGSDVGMAVLGGNNNIFGCRADINYGHGFLLTRDNAAASPPQTNRFTGAWGHRNSRYGSNLFDNFRIEPGKSISGTKISGCGSSYNGSDGWAHRHGIFDGGAQTKIVGFYDAGAQTKDIDGAAGYAGIDVTSLDGTVVADTTTGATLDAKGKSMFRLNPTAARTLTTITGGTNGQEIDIQAQNGNLTINSSGVGAGQIRTASNAPITLQQWQTVRLKFVLGAWFQLGEAQRNAYTFTSPTTTRTLNPATATAADVANVLATLVADLKAAGLSA